jgi:hypothetical protein
MSRVSEYILGKTDQADKEDEWKLNVHLNKKRLSAKFCLHRLVCTEGSSRFIHNYTEEVSVRTQNSLVGWQEPMKCPTNQ